MKLLYACGKVETLRPLGKGRYLHEDGSIGTPPKPLLDEFRRFGIVKIASKYDRSPNREPSSNCLLDEG